MQVKKHGAQDIFSYDKCDMLTVFLYPHAIAGDLQQVLFRAKRAGVERMIVTAGNVSDCKEAIDLVKGQGNNAIP